VNQVRDKYPCEAPNCKKLALWEDIIERLGDDNKSLYIVGNYALCDDHHREIEDGQYNPERKEKVQLD
jgi:hypothetical protein